MQHVQRTAPRHSTRAGLVEGERVPVTRMKVRHLPLKKFNGEEIVLNSRHLLVYATLLTFSASLEGDRATARVELGKLIELTGLSERSVSRLLSDLVSVGFIVRKKRLNRASITYLWQDPGHHVHEV